MIKVTLNEEEFLLADNWKDISFGQYVDVLAIQQDKWTNLESTIKIISILSNRPKELETLLYNIDIEDFEQLSEIMSWVNTDFISIASTVEPKDKFFIEGKDYVIKKDYKKLTLGEMVTVETMIKDVNYNPQEIALGILVRELVDGKESQFNEEFFFKVINELKYKINLIEIYQYLAFFLSGDKIPTGEISKGFSIQKI